MGRRMEAGISMTRSPFGSTMVATGFGMCSSESTTRFSRTFPRSWKTLIGQLATSPQRWNGKASQTDRGER